jgi:hypothetical protein
VGVVVICIVLVLFGLVEMLNNDCGGWVIGEVGIDKINNIDKIKNNFSGRRRWPDIIKQSPTSKQHNAQAFRHQPVDFRDNNKQANQNNRCVIRKTRTFR